MGPWENKTCGTAAKLQRSSITADSKPLYRDIGQAQEMLDAQKSSLLKLAKLENAKEGFSGDKELFLEIDLENPKAATTRVLENIWRYS